MSRRFYRWIISLLALSVFLYLGFHFFVQSYIPDQMKLFVGEEKQFNYEIPFEAEISGDIQGAITLNSEKVPKDEISINMRSPFTISSLKTGKFNVGLKLLGFLLIKNVEIEVIDQEAYVPCGNMVGVTVQTEGVMVLGTGQIINENGNKVSPCREKLFSGDYIRKVNGEDVNSKEELMAKIQEGNGKEIVIGFERNGIYGEETIIPTKTAVNDEYKLGVWVRDDTQGIGTLTYVDPKEDVFGALGHGITDVDTGQLMKLSGGTLVTSLITNISKGEKGNPGEISGIIIEEHENVFGNVEKNTSNGIFGHVTDKGIEELEQYEEMQIGFKYDVKIGLAYIRTDVSGELKDYEIQIEKVFINDTSNKGMIIKVTDKNLLNITNGIIQGMSGSPIIQDGKLIGAVTHVFVQDSTKGYGTFIENMILED